MLQSFEFLCTQRSGQGIVQINFSTYSSLAGNSGRLNRVRLQQPQEQCYPFLTVRAVFSCVQSKVWLPMFGIFNVRTDVNACDCTRGLYGHRKRVCTESELWEKNSLPHRGIEPASAACWFHALPTELPPRPFTVVAAEAPTHHQTQSHE